MRIVNSPVKRLPLLTCDCRTRLRFSLLLLSLLWLGALPLAAQAQLVPLPALPQQLPTLPVSPAEIIADQQLKARQRWQQLDQQATRQLTVQLKNSLDPLRQLPSSLPIVGQNQQLLWREVEVSPGVRAVEREWLLALDAAQWQQLVQQQPSLAAYVVEQQNYPQLELSIYRLRLPEVLDQQLALDPKLSPLADYVVARNHIYQPQQAQAAAPATSAMPKQLSICPQPLQIGLLDSAVQRQHPAFTNPDAIQSKNFLPKELAQDEQHGTAVASILIGRLAGNPPLLPGATLFNAAVFYQQNAYQQGATLGHMLQALDWLASQPLRVINLSLTGPANSIFARAIQALAARGIILVAAAGNGGPAAAPLYPAAYPQVLAVTAVDKQQQIYRWANQGTYIDFAAPGVAVPVASAGGGEAQESGTSLATPVVSALAACLMQQHPTWTLVELTAALAAIATDLGAAGRDPIFGDGLLQVPAAALLH